MHTPCQEHTSWFLCPLRGLFRLQFLLILCLWIGDGVGMSKLQIDDLRHEAEQMFYHGYDNYMKHAFPEDELRPISCAPLTRDRHNPGHIELNDALGNYSLTLIDSLSTLAVMASTPDSISKKKRALDNFQSGVKAMVEQYGDGTNSASGKGKRARGFNVDSKVQVFETVIRGVGGLLSAHLFAMGELPISGYNPKRRKRKEGDKITIKWQNKFTYDGQLLRLAEDLARRLLPAFLTPTGMPYPRVNLRYGVPFYANSPLNRNAEEGQCPLNPGTAAEITETCSAGAGSLVLEFTTLTRLTGDPIFEQVAKLAFWSVWDRKSVTGLVGSGINAETGRWTTPYTGIGAGIDSFYEYAAKASVLLSGSPIPDDLPTLRTVNGTKASGPVQMVSEYQQTASAFEQAWQESHAAIKKHLYRGHQHIHPHYLQADLFTGASRAFWVDSLSAFYPGLLASFGELDEAIETHLLFTALWTRYSALPERWSVSSGGIEGGLGWWGGRPEFIESTYHIYLATKDSWYLHVGEMALRDIKRRCWTSCGFSGLQDVKSGDKSDRMESFFLGETIKYLFLLFTPDHPLNKLDKPFVFTTEGHPLIIPRSSDWDKAGKNVAKPHVDFATEMDDTVCPLPPAAVPFSISATAARSDIFHAAKLACLHHMPTRETVESPLIEYSHDHPSIAVSDVRSPSNFTYYPWTLPLHLVPYNGISSPIQMRKTLDITFPALPNTILGPQSLQRVLKGIYIHSMSGLRLSMVKDLPLPWTGDGQESIYRVQAINNIPLGKDERVYLPKPTLLAAINPTDPNFTLTKDNVLLDLVVAIPPIPPSSNASSLQSSMTPAVVTSSTTSATGQTAAGPLPSILLDPPASDADPAVSSIQSALASLLQNIGLLLNPPSAVSANPTSPASDPSTSATSPSRHYIPAILPVGPGAAPLPDFEDTLPPTSDGQPQGSLPWGRIFLAGSLCGPTLPAFVPRDHEVLVIKRGGCSFAEKLSHIPTLAPNKMSLKVVVIISYPEHEPHRDGADVEGAFLTRPELAEEQSTSSGMRRRNPLSMVMVQGGEETWEVLERVSREEEGKVGLKRRYDVHAQGIKVGNLVIL